MYNDRSRRSLPRTCIIGLHQKGRIHQSDWCLFLKFPLPFVCTVLLCLRHFLLCVQTCRFGESQDGEKGSAVKRCCRGDRMEPTSTATPERALPLTLVGIERGTSVGAPTPLTATIPGRQHHLWRYLSSSSASRRLIYHT